MSEAEEPKHGDRRDERWERIDDLFERALDEPADRWDAFLAKECEDPDVRAKVRRLLEADRASDGFLEGPLDPEVASAWDEAMAATTRAAASEFDRSGERVGAYRLLERVARGGMASVYLAEREDGGWKQRVAVKVIRHGLDTEDVVARFLAERQILSTLTHPNIARLLDGGATEDGRPFFAMEFVEGRPVTIHCDEERLDIEGRLALFAQIGEAVAHAHRRLVIHRDIKPSNILVTADGTAKLLDFGIAKLLDPAAWPGEAHRTRTGIRLMTPECASPEQLRGAAVTTASDVFQMGVLLFRLLTGSAPFADESGSLATRSTRDPSASAPRPSTLLRQTEREALGRIAAARATSPAALERAIAGDLEQIVLKALDENPERRYHSAEAMVEDVRRFLSGHPVQARPAGPVYKTRRFFGRHRWVGPAGAVAALAVIGYITTLVRHNTALELERTAAEAEARTARSVTDFVVGLFGTTAPFEGGRAEMPARELLGRGAEQVLAGPWESPEVRARLVEAVARAYHDLDLFREAADFLEAAMASGDATPARELLSLQSLLGFSLIQIGDHAEGRAILQRAVDTRRATGDTASVGQIRDLAAISTALFLEGDGEEGLRVTAEWLPYAQGLENDPDQLTLMALDRLFHLSMNQLTYEHADALALEQLAQARATYADTTPPVAHAYEDLASLRFREGRFEEAVEPAERSTALSAAMFGEDNATTSYAAETLAQIYLELGRHEDALALQETVVDVRVRALGAEHMILPMTRYNLARTLRVNDRLDEADTELAWAIERTVAAFGAESRLTAVMTEELARLRTAQGRLDEAEILLAQAGDRYVVLYDPTDLRRVSWTLAMADLRERQGRAAEAEALLRETADALRLAGMSEHALGVRVGRALARIGER